MIIRKFTEGNFRVVKFNKRDKRVIVRGCTECKECCGEMAGYQPLVLLPNQNPNNFHSYGMSLACIHPSMGCKQLGVDKGCRLNPKERPVLCNIYPFRFCGKRIVAHIVCPAVQNTPIAKLQKIGLEVFDYFRTLPCDFLYRACEEYIAYQLIDLRLPLDDI